MKIDTRDLTPGHWPDIERLFGKNGACAGCWCMFWRLEKGERLRNVQGATAKRRMRKLVEAGRAEGILAFADGEPVGWLALGRRREFKALDRAPSLACDDADDVWSLPCFFVRRDHRGRGVATALLAAGVKALRKRGAAIAEGYPVKTPRPGESIPPAFAYTGTIPLFEHQGFEIVAEKPRGKQRVRLTLPPARRSPSR